MCRYYDPRQCNDTYCTHVHPSELTRFDIDCRTMPAGPQRDAETTPYDPAQGDSGPLRTLYSGLWTTLHRVCPSSVEERGRTSVRLDSDSRNALAGAKRRLVIVTRTINYYKLIPWDQELGVSLK